jgi:hypothetical protein
MRDFKNNQIEESLIDSFEKVKEAVKKYEGRSRAGLMLGLQELGSDNNGFIGAYYQVASNIIIVNTTPIRRILETNPRLLKPYGFHILLHEYMHTLGCLKEDLTEEKTYNITKKYFGENHIATMLSRDIKKFLPNLIYPIDGFVSNKKLSDIKLVKGFDWSNSNHYIN